MRADKTTERLNAIVESVESVPLRDELVHQFFIVNALQFAQFLHSLSLPDATKGKLLALKVGMPPSYKGVDLGPLVERAAEQMWARLAENVRGLGTL